MAENTIEKSNVPATRGEDRLQTTREPGRHIVPAVDIFENDQGLVVVADVAGVSKDGLDISVDDDILTIHGTVSHPVPEGTTYQEYELADYYRQFHLGEQVDREGITAELRNGVLTLQLPKAEAAKPRRIDVRVGQ
jgi:HSP20 family molecular chaperone IbpA